jgi:hypothetical protein
VGRDESDSGEWGVRPHHSLRSRLEVSYETLIAEWLDEYQVGRSGEQSARAGQDCESPICYIAVADETQSCRNKVRWSCAPHTAIHCTADESSRSGATTCFPSCRRSLTVSASEGVSGVRSISSGSSLTPLSIGGLYDASVFSDPRLSYAHRLVIDRALAHTP